MLFRDLEMKVRGQAVLIAGTPDDHIKVVDLPPLGVIQRPVAHNCHCPHPRLPEGGAQRVLLHFRVTQRGGHCGIDPWHISCRLLQAPAQASLNLCRPAVCETPKCTSTENCRCSAQRTQLPLRVI